MNRRRLSLRDKVAILMRYCPCPGCGTSLAAAPVQWDHLQALARGGSDTNDNMQPLCEPCHAIKTRGLPATTRGSDIHEIARTRRLTQKEKDFRASLLRKDAAFLPADYIDTALNAARPKPKRKIPPRPFPKRKPHA